MLTNDEQQLKLLYSTLEQQLPGRRAQSLIVKSYTENNNQFDKLIAPVVTFYSIKSRLHVDGDTTTTMDTTRNGCNEIVSTAIEIGLVFLEIRITKAVNNSVAANISNGADSASATQENRDGILVTDKHAFGAKNTLGFDNTSEVTIPTTLEVYNIPTSLEVYNIPGNTLKVSSIPTANTTLEVCISHSRKYAEGIQYFKHKR